VKITVEKVDDINTIISGTVENKIIEAKVARLKEEAKNASSEAEVSTEKVLEKALDNMDTDTFQRDAEGEMLKEFIEHGMKEANINVDDILGQPGF
jgi:hypothetical protein